MGTFETAFNAGAIEQIKTASDKLTILIKKAHETQEIPISKLQEIEAGLSIGLYTFGRVCYEKAIIEKTDKYNDLIKACWGSVPENLKNMKGID